MKRKHLRILVPILVLVLAAGVLLLQQLQKTEPVYFRTAAFGELSENLEGDPFTVYCWRGGDTYVPVFTEERENFRPMSTALTGHTLYYALWSGEDERDSLVYRVDLETGERELLAELDFQVREMSANGSDLFLTVYRSEAGHRIGVLREGTFMDCGSVFWPYSTLACDDSGCWYVDYDSETHFSSLCYLPADTLVPVTVYEHIPHPIELRAVPEGVYLSCEFGEDYDAGTFSLFFYPRDGSGEVKLLTELLPDGRVVTENKREDFVPIFTLWGERLFYVTYIGWSKGVDGEDVGYYLHCLDRKTGRVTEYGKIRADTGVGTVPFQYLLTCGKRGFLLNESNWWATDPEEANSYSFYTWSGKRTELHNAGRSS
jgi:hypothetical protein